MKNEEAVENICVGTRAKQPRKLTAAQRRTVAAAWGQLQKATAAFDKLGLTLEAKVGCKGYNLAWALGCPTVGQLALRELEKLGSDKH